MNPEMLDSTIARLRHISLFSSLGDDLEALQRIAELFDIISHRKGETVINEGSEDGNKLFILKSGTVQICKKTMDGDPYTVLEIDADSHAFFGEVALLDPDKRSATARCKTDCAFYVLDRERFIQFGDEFPRAGLLITRELSRIVCQRLRKANTDMIILFDALVGEVEASGGLAD
jgi:CRP/FNR family cyclic AMP-dependent transcriptional regulator